MQMNSDYLVTDPKGETLPRVGQHARGGGLQDTVVQHRRLLEVAALQPPRLRARRGRHPGVRLLPHIQHLRGPASTRGDPFWENAERLLYVALIGYLVYRCPPRGPVALGRRHAAVAGEGQGSPTRATEAPSTCCSRRSRRGCATWPRAPAAIPGSTPRGGGPTSLPGACAGCGVGRPRARRTRTSRCSTTRCSRTPRARPSNRSSSRATRAWSPSPSPRCASS